MVFFFLRFFILFIFRQREREGEREGEKHQCVVASPVPPTGDLAHNSGTCPAWLGIKPATLWFTGWCLIHWATTARAHDGVLNIRTLVFKLCPRTQDPYPHSHPQGHVKEPDITPDSTRTAPPPCGLGSQYWARPHLYWWIPRKGFEVQSPEKSKSSYSHLRSWAKLKRVLK